MPTNSELSGHARWEHRASGTAPKQQLNHLKKDSKEGYVSPKYFVLAYLQIGEKDRAFEWLEKAYEERGEVLLYLKVDPRFDPLRSHPRFADLLRRIGHAS